MISDVKKLQGANKEERLSALKTLYQQLISRGEIPQVTEEVNNHVHSIYSFSPYSPVQAAYMAWKAGLKAVGIMDHDSYAGAGEMEEACKILGLGSTCGVELRVNCKGSAMEYRSLNYPDSTGIFYMALHGVPLSQEELVMQFLKPIQKARNLRNRRQTEALNYLIAPYGLEPLDFEKDVAGFSRALEGGSITERHILAALAHRIMETYPSGKAVLSFLQQQLKLKLSGKIIDFLKDKDNPHYLYDLLGALKSGFLPRFFIQPDDQECINVQTAVDFARSIGAISAYAYLGDVSDSPTGDKKAQKFEDDFLDELMIQLKQWGFQAVTFMPPRNSPEQLTRLMNLCYRHDFMQISGVDINSSRQSFSCPEVLKPEFVHLNRSTWALIAHEKISCLYQGTGIFGNHSLASIDQPLSDRIEFYARLGKKLNLHQFNIEALYQGLISR